MKTILVLLTVATGLLVSACETGKKAPASGPTSGVKSQSVHAGNTTGDQATAR